MAFPFPLFTPYSLFSTKQPNFFFFTLSQIISLLCSKSNNGSQLTPTKSQSPCNGEQCSSSGPWITYFPPGSLRCGNSVSFSSLNTNHTLTAGPLSGLIHREHSSTSKHGLHLHLRVILALIQLLRLVSVTTPENDRSRLLHALSPASRPLSCFFPKALGIF